MAGACTKHGERADKLVASMRPAVDDSDGLMRDALPRDAVVIAGGNRAGAGEPSCAARCAGHAGSRIIGCSPGPAWVPDLQPLAAWNEAEEEWRSR
ncbi:MAG TPA: hypothetical protein VM406_12660 [Noviherbaspirillum sp.]|nr:hypothetical protein [Noviherbaspirillum sp.]